MELTEAKSIIDTYRAAGKTRDQTVEMVSLLPLNGEASDAFKYVDLKYQTTPGITDIFNLTDAGNAEHFTGMHADSVRYDHRRGRWLEWDDSQYWKPENDGNITRKALDSIRKRYHDAATIENLKEKENVSKWAISSEQRGRLDAMLGIARNLKPIADSGENWDADPWLLGIQNGVYDLRSNTFRAGRQSDRITMQAGTVYDPNATAPRWEQFLNEVFCRDGQLISWIQKYFGYALTGDVSEQCLCIGHGRGANGKSVLLVVLRYVLGDYGYDAPFSTFELYQRASIPNDMAALYNRRFIASSETNEGSRLNEARIKALTGGDSITARFLHQEWFTFNPTGKLFLAVNHKPRINDDSLGFWRRVRLIPFDRQFTGTEADKKLTEKLIAESPGILNWLLEGCQRWQNEGLDDIPATITAATTDYENESDPLNDFINDECAFGELHTVPASRLYQQYKAWCEREGFQNREVLSSTAFGRRMSAKFKKEKGRTGATYHGIALKCDGFLNVGDGLEGRNDISLYMNPSRGENTNNPSQPVTEAKNPSQLNVTGSKKPVTNPSQLPDCPKCGRNEWTFSTSCDLMKCPCGHEIKNFPESE